MKRLFSVLFVVCAVCIFPKLSFAAEDGTYLCSLFCTACQDCKTPAAETACMEHLLDVAGCNNGFDSCVMVGIDESSAGNYAYSNITLDKMERECKTSSGGDGGNTPGSGTSNKCTVRFCPGDNICPNNFIEGFGSSSHTSGNSLPTPSYADLHDGPGSAPGDKILKGWSTAIDEDVNNILAPGAEVTISCNNGVTVYYYPKWGNCEGGEYASQGSCVSCPTGFKCPDGVKTACNNGYFQNVAGQSTCQTCPAGHYSQGAPYGVEVCSEITGGHYCTGTNSAGGCNAIETCPAGSACTGGNITTCGVGTYSEAGWATCTDCPKGTSSNITGATKCSLCTTTKYQDYTGQTTCKECTNGVASDCIDAEGPKGCRKCDLCDVGYWCSGEASTQVWDGYYATGCSSGELDGSNNCVGANCKGCTGQLPCPEGYYCKDGVKKKCRAGTYSTGGTKSCTACGDGKWSSAGASGCSDISAGCYGTSAGSACPNECTSGTYSVAGKASCTACGPGKWSSAKASGCSDISAGCYGTSAGSACPAKCPEGEYSGGGAASCATCSGGHYLDGCDEGTDTGCKECKSCPDGTIFATSAVVGVKNCGLQTCEYYYENSGIKDTLGSDWLEKREDCGAEICYMAPTMEMGNQKVDTDEPLQAKCCEPGGTLGECFYPNGTEPCSASCTGCTGGLPGGGCREDQQELTDKDYTCPGVREADSSSCEPIGGDCLCPFDSNLIRCEDYEYINPAANGDKVCYEYEDGKDRSNYCQDVCYESCDIYCTQQCSGIRTKDGVRSCSDIEKKYEDAGRKYKDSSCVYYINDVPQEKAPNCSVKITCIENWYNPTPNGCTECSPGSHTSDGNTENTCTANTYYLKYDANDGAGQMERTTCTYGKSCTLSANIFSRKGYTFAGWATSKTGNVEYEDGKTVVSLTTENGKEIILYAKWTANTYYAKYSCGEGDGTPNPPEDSATFDKDYTVDATKDRGCKKNWSLFQGWKGKNNEDTIFAEYNKTKTYKWTQADNITFTAQWKPCDACDTSSPGSNCTLEVIDNTCKYTTSCKDGYTAVEEYKNTYQPKCTPNVYEVTLDRAGGEGGTSNYFYQYETEGDCYYYKTRDLSECIGGVKGVQIDNPMRTGYTFDGYYTAENGGGTQYVNNEGTTINNIYLTKGDKKLYAKWTAIKYYATYYCNGGVVGDPVLVAFDTEYTVDATSRGCLKPGSLFRGWEGKNNEDTIFAPYKGNTSFFWTQADNIDFTAIWDACPKGYYCKEGLEKKEECPVGSTNGGGAIEIQQCYLAGGQSKICSKIGDDEPKCFLLPQGVNVNYSGVE